MSFWTFWGSFRPFEIVVIAVIGLLAVSAIERTRSIKLNTNRRLLTANWFVVIALTLSLKPIYEAVDPLLGGHNYTNLIQRSLIAYAGYAVTYSLAEMARKIFQEERSPSCMHRKWFLFSLAGTLIAFVWMGASAHTSRGLDGYASEYFAYTLYQCSTLIALLAGSRYLLPRLWRIAQDSSDARLRIQIRTFLASYLCAIGTVLFYLLTPISPLVIGVREVFVYATVITLAAGFMMVNREKRSVTLEQGTLRPV